MKLKIPIQYDHLGYDFGDINEDGFIHPGVDLNAGSSAHADLGMKFFPMADGIVEFSKDTGDGWGNLIVVFHPDLENWTRYGHAHERLVQKGQEVSPDFAIGTVGATGGDWTPHLHFDVIKEKLTTWTKFTKGMSMAQVEKVYENPLEYIEKMNNGSISENPLVKDTIRPTVSAMWKALEILKQDTDNNGGSWGTINTAQQYLNKCNNTLRNN